MVYKNLISQLNSFEDSLKFEKRVNDCWKKWKEIEERRIASDVNSVIPLL